MPSSSKPRRKYRPKTNLQPSVRTAPWQTYATYNEVDRIFTQMERTGMSDADGKGNVIFRPTWSGNYFRVGEALTGLAEMFEIYSRKSGRDIDTGPLHRFVTKITHNSPLFQSDIDDARGCAQRLMKIAQGLTRQEAATLVRDAQLKFEIEALPR